MLEREVEAIRRDIDQRDDRRTQPSTSTLPSEVEPRPELTPPVTQADIERTLLQSGRIKDNLQAHPSLAGAYHLWHEGTSVPVTFDPRLFDEKPETVRLLSYGDEVFADLIDESAVPDEQSLPPWITRVSSQEPVLCGYYRATQTGLQPILSLTELEAALAEQAPSFDAERLAAATALFEAQVQAITTQQEEVEERRLRAERAAVYERARILLLRATYIDLAMSMQRGLFDQGNIAGFTEDAVLNLRRHGYPFAPLIRLVGVEGIRPTPTDPDWTSVQDASLDNLRKRFEAVKKETEEVLGVIAER